MIDALISSKTRIKLLLKFFLNSNARAYLRSLESEFGESSNAIRLELNRLENAGLLTSNSEGNKKIFQANTDHPLFAEIHSIIRKHIGLDQIVENIIHRLGELRCVYLVGDFSRGVNSQVIDLIFVGEVDRMYLLELSDKVEKIIHRKIRYLVYDHQEAEEIDWTAHQPEPLILWKKDSMSDEL